MQRRWVSLAGVVLTPTVSCGPQAAAVDDAPMPVRVEIDRVIDGDTVIVRAAATVEGPEGQPIHGERVRLLGVDAPEVTANACFSAEAWRFARNEIDQRTVTLEFDPTRCRPSVSIDSCRGDYGRLLAYVHYAGSEARVLNEQLLRTGHARVLRGPARFRHRDSARYEALERSAARAGLGLWACP